ncbi:MAG: glutamine synthetase [Deltaproteobacteria bacterium]|nr:glutamine synthetase [Deltaproteobacteria bacterium]
MTGTEAEELVADLQARGIERVKVGGFDIDGVLRGKYISLRKLRSALSGGFGFCDVIFGWDINDKLYDQPSVTGWHRGYPDAQAVLDPSTLRDLPWEPGVAAMLVDFRDEAGGPHPACSRSVLKTVRDRARALGYEPHFACEYEFFLFQETPQTLQNKGFCDLQPLDPGMYGYSWLRSGQSEELMGDIMSTLKAFDVELEGLHTETGPGVYEAAIAVDGDVLRAADKAALFKAGLKQIAHEHGLTASFMAKWHAQYPGCSGHLHQSLFRDGTNAFHNPEDPQAMSTCMRHYLGGLCQLMPELTAVTSPNVNSYKRYVPGVWAPLTVSWGIDNRTAAVRVIGLDQHKACRLEFRQPASDINPYLAMAASLAAGLYGIEQQIEPPDETKGDASNEGAPLPRTLTAAVDLLESSDVARQILGTDVVSHYVVTRRWELQEFERAVTDWELKRYFESI